MSYIHLTPNIRFDARSFTLATAAAAAVLVKGSDWISDSHTNGFHLHSLTWCHRTNLMQRTHTHRYAPTDVDLTTFLYKMCHSFTEASRISELDIKIRKNKASVCHVTVSRTHCYLTV